MYQLLLYKNTPKLIGITQKSLIISHKSGIGGIDSSGDLGWAWFTSPGLNHGSMIS